MAKILDAKAIKATFNYNKETGKLTLAISRGRGGVVKIGTEVGCTHICGSRVSKKAYLRTLFIGSSVYVHRIIWVWMTGEQPNTIDHIDGNGLNNRWKNLRNVSHRINGKNQKIHTTNTSGVAGVCYRKDSKKWRSRIMVDGKMISLGDFTNKDQAIDARSQAEKDLWK